MTDRAPGDPVDRVYRTRLLAEQHVPHDLGRLVTAIGMSAGLAATLAWVGDR